MKKQNKIMAVIALVAMLGGGMGFQLKGKHVFNIFYTTDIIDGMCTEMTTKSFTTTFLRITPAFATTLGAEPTTASCPTIWVIATP